MGSETLTIIPITLKQAKEFIALHHRHNKPPTGWKFGIGLEKNGCLIGVATAGRPVARALDDGLTIEINRTCTDGTKNANSKLYGAAWRAAKAMGYVRGITYTQSAESGASLRGAGWKEDAVLPARKSWAESSVILKDKKDKKGNGGIDRTRWVIGSKSSELQEAFDIILRGEVTQANKTPEPLAQSGGSE